ncbi:MAG: tetratricopeptide repeat protein, partial [Verrucomicrobiota bacterium JB022]|nr:tetratricopeptide repeat protein [Verrucomicrobiota bacterium JB022]
MFNAHSKESGTTNLLHMLESRVESLIEKGRFEEARETAEAAVSKARSLHASGDNGIVELALSLEVMGDLLRQSGDYHEGREAYEEALELLRKQRANHEQRGRVSASLAVLNDLDDMPAEAKRFYERAIAHFRRLDPPALLDIADLSNNLAFFYDAEGNFEEAEGLLLEALKISHEELGSEHEQTGLVCNNLGGLYYRYGQFEQAREMHMMALDARLASLGEKHADTAQSYANLALVHATMENRERAQ